MNYLKKTVLKLGLGWNGRRFVEESGSKSVSKVFGLTANRLND